MPTNDKYHDRPSLLNPHGIEFTVNSMKPQRRWYTNKPARDAALSQLVNNPLATIKAKPIEYN